MAAVNVILDRPDPEPDDLEVLDAAWEEEEVRFGPDAAACGKETLAAKIRANIRPAEGLPERPRQQTKFTYSSTRS